MLEERGITQLLSLISAKSGRQLPTDGRWPVMMALPCVIWTHKIIILTWIFTCWRGPVLTHGKYESQKVSELSNFVHKIFIL
jgi:hypothetical protein